MNIRQIISVLVSAVLLLSACHPLCYDFVIDSVDEGNTLPQGCSVVNIKYSYVFVETKLEVGEAFKSFRYRAFIDGEEYSYAVDPPGMNDSTAFSDRLSNNSFQVVVPENDTYQERDISIEVSVCKSFTKDFTKDDWGEWQEVYSGVQMALAPGEPHHLPDLDKCGIEIGVDGIMMDVDLNDSESVRSLKAFLSKGDYTFYAEFADNIISTHPSDSLFCNVPLNYVHYTSVKRGDVYMGCRGNLYIENETHKHGINGWDTYIGRISESSMDNLGKICGNRSYHYDGRALTLRLVK